MQHRPACGEPDETPNLGPALPTPIVQHSVLTEWQATDPALDAFAGTSRELIRIAAPHNHHNLGEISFNPSASPGSPDYGLLYLAAGDFGSVQSNQPEQLQRLDTPYGALLRIDPLAGPFERGGTLFSYGIPGSNPFANDGDPDTLGEIYAYGFRNGHRLVWDTADSGAVFVTDVGEGNVEEINVLADPGVARTDLRVARGSSGGIFITTKQDAFVRRLVPVEIAYPNGWSLLGVAVGGFPVTFEVSGVALEITTTSGQTADEVAAAMVAAIQLDGALQGLGVHGYATGGEVWTNGSVGGLVIADPGISEAPLPSVPALPGGGLAAIAAGLLLAAARIRRLPRPAR